MKDEKNISGDKNTMEELDFDSLKMDKGEDLSSTIEKQIDRRIKKISLKVILTVLGVLALIFLLINPALYLASPNLKKHFKENEKSLLQDVLHAYYETMDFSDISYYGIRDIKMTGFGRYELSLMMFKRGSEIRIPVSKVKLEMFAGKFRIKEDPEFLAGPTLLSFTTGIQQRAKDVIKVYEELPDSAYIMMGVAFDKPVPLGDILEMKEQGIYPFWIRFATDSDFQGGMALNNLVRYRNDEIDRADATPEELKRVYISNLELLRDNMKLWSGLEMFWDTRVSGECAVIERLNETIEGAENCDPMLVEIVSLEGKKDDIIAFLKENPDANIVSKDVRLSQYSHYN